MTKDELLAKQQLEIEGYKAKLIENAKILRKIHGKFYNIGQPLNDNVMQFNKEQIKWCFQVFEIFDQLN